MHVVCQVYGAAGALKDGKDELTLSGWENESVYSVTEMEKLIWHLVQGHVFF